MHGYSAVDYNAVSSCYYPCSYTCCQTLVNNNAYNNHDKSVVVANYNLKCVSVFV